MPSGITSTVRCSTISQSLFGPTVSGADSSGGGTERVPLRALLRIQKRAPTRIRRQTMLTADMAAITPDDMEFDFEADGAGEGDTEAGTGL